MRRHCNGTDPNLVTLDGQPCRCDLMFNDIDRETVFPHLRILSAGERAQVMVREMHVILPALKAAHPGLDWDTWAAEVRATAQQQSAGDVRIRHDQIRDYCRHGVPMDRNCARCAIVVTEV